MWGFLDTPLFVCTSQREIKAFLFLLNSVLLSPPSICCGVCLSRDRLMGTVFLHLPFLPPFICLSKSSQISKNKLRNVIYKVNAPPVEKNKGDLVFCNINANE
jgi:hypothetical protein